ncbi:MAG: DMT family transporter [Tannerella sp.]|nr:DMT family transporter [Tannerella sp.]
MAGITTVIWGTTMVASKALLNEGLSPAQIMFYRFLLGYVFLWILYPRTHSVRSLRDEAFFAGMGVFGGSLYFLTENSALVYAQATDVSLICASVPLIAAILSHFVLGERLSRGFRMGSAVAMIGITLVILNGNFVLKMSPLGDILAFAAICCWAVYCLLVKKLRHNYSTMFITRRLFLYGLLTLSPYFLYEPFHFSVEILQRPAVWGNLLFLGLIASSLCYVMWNSAMRELGIVKTNSYLYFSPVVTIITAAIVLSEHVTAFILTGAALILLGLWIAGRK